MSKFCQNGGSPLTEGGLIVTGKPSSDSYAVTYKGVTYPFRTK